VSDIAAALQLALESPGVPGGTVLHAASGVETTAAALADLCRRTAGRPGHPVEYQPARPGEVGRNFASYDLARRLLGYSPAVRIEEGVPELWRWFQQNMT
jgi:nucleoside-diphosphate-sugar epimerase